MIVIAGSFRFDDGVTEDVTAACKSVMEATHQEEGCHEYIFYPCLLYTSDAADE